jgi:hypothetical protein
VDHHISIKGLEKACILRNKGLVEGRPRGYRGRRSGCANQARQSPEVCRMYVVAQGRIAGEIGSGPPDAFFVLHYTHVSISHTQRALA